MLVTGGSGFIGRHVTAALREAGAEVRVLDLVAYPDPEVETVVGDLIEPDVIAAGLEGRVDRIVHLAAVTSVLKSVEHPELTYRTNVAATAQMLEAARQAGVSSVVFASTNAVAGPVPEGTVISEANALHPLTPYGATKAAAEMLISAYDASYGLRGCCLRFTNVYGLGMQAKDSIVARLMRVILGGGEFEIYGAGRQVRDYLHVGDVVAAIGKALVDDRWSGPVTLGAGASLSVLDVLDAVRRVSGADLPARHVPAKAGEMPAVVVDTSHALDLGWKAEMSLEEGLAGVWAEWSARAKAGEPRAKASEPRAHTGGSGAKTEQ